MGARPWAARAAAVIFFIHTVVFGGALVSGFWSVISERFDPHTAKHLMGRIAGGAAQGGIMGGLGAERLAAFDIELLTMLPLVAGTQLVSALGILRVRSRSKPDVPPTKDADSQEESTLRLLTGSPYLRRIALLVGLGALVSTITGYMLKAEAARSFAQGDQLLRFFAIYYLALGLLAFLFQAALSRFCLTRFGLAVAVATLPAGIVVGAVGVLILPTLWSVAILRGTDDVFTSSLFRSGYELLYTPIALGRKRRVKTFVDVGLDRVGKILGGGLIMLIAWVLSDTPVRLLAAICVGGALGGLHLASRLHRGYVAALGESLRSGAVALGGTALVDATTRATLAEATGGPGREKLLEVMSSSPRSSPGRDVELTISDGDAALWGAQSVFAGLLREETPAAAAFPDNAETLAKALRTDRLLASIAELRSGVPERVHRLLDETDTLDRHLVSYAISLLAHDDLSRDAIRALGKVAQRSTGQLIDVLLDPGGEYKIRRRLPFVLGECSSSVAVDGLLTTLGDKGFELRYRSARAPARIRAADPSLAIPKEAVFEAAGREIDRDKGLWDSQSLIDSPGDSLESQSLESPLVDDYLRRRGDRGLEIVFTILSLALEPEPLNLAFRALSTKDQKLRGTAIEYLETVLPETIRKKLWPYVGAEPRVAESRRSHEQALSELLKSSQTMAVDLEALRRRLRQDDENG